MKYTCLWLLSLPVINFWRNNRYEKVVSGFVRGCLGWTNWEMDERTRECSRSGGNSKCSLCFFWGSWIGGPNPGIRPKNKDLLCCLCFVRCLGGMTGTYTTTTCPPVRHVRVQSSQGRPTVSGHIRVSPNYGLAWLRGKDRVLSNSEIRFRVF